eukprot:6282486-Ditylum_brightwellii.AAC.1
MLQMLLTKTIVIYHAEVPVVIISANQKCSQEMVNSQDDAKKYCKGNPATTEQRVHPVIKYHITNALLRAVGGVLLSVIYKVCNTYVAALCRMCHKTDCERVYTMPTDNEAMHKLILLDKAIKNQVEFKEDQGKEWT